MKISKLIVALPVLALALSSTPLVFAQSSASSDMKSAGNSAADAASEAYRGTARAVKDTAITAKVRPRCMTTWLPRARTSMLIPSPALRP